MTISNCGVRDKLPMRNADLECADTSALWSDATCRVEGKQCRDTAIPKSGDVSPHGQKYVIIGRVESPGGKSPLVKTIWIVDSGVETARLVTAYPHNE